MNESIYQPIIDSCVNYFQAMASEFIESVPDWVAPSLLVLGALIVVYKLVDVVAVILEVREYKKSGEFL